MKRVRPTHLDERGRMKMVNVGEKPETLRRAVAEARLRLSPATIAAIKKGKTPKGDVGAVVRLAAIQGGKKTSDLIPLCHPIRLDHLEVTVRFEKTAAVITASAETTGKTGVEMEAMTAASVGALALYDMIKGIERDASIESVVLLEKSGGRSGHYRRR